MAATVQHGRRSGTTRAIPQQEFVFGNESNNVDLRSVTVLTKDDWTRITGQLHKQSNDRELRRKAWEERESLKNRSKEIVKDWDNTLLGARQKKLDERAARLAKEEELKKQQDIEEAQLAAEARKKILEEAKVKQYYQTDRVKNFHTALRFTEVLKEREAQLELKKLMTKANEGQDAKYLEIWQREYEDSVRHDQEEAAEKIYKRRECSKHQKEQIRQHQMQMEAEKHGEDHEGDELRRLAVAHALERKRLEQIHREEQRQNMKDNLKQIADVKHMKDVQKLLDEEEDEECRIFAAAKKKMMRLRAEKEREIHLEKQNNLNKIKDRLANELAAKKSDEEDRLYNAIQEREQKLADEEADKSKKQREMMESIKRDRDAKEKRLELAEQERRQQEMEMIRVRKEADELFQKKEAERKLAKFEGERNLKDYHKKQADLICERAELQTEENMAYEAANVRLLEQEEEQFQRYANNVIEHCERGGRNTLPLRRAANAGVGGGLGPQFPGKGGVRPSYQTADKKGLQLPHYKRGSTEQVKETQQGISSTSKRIGMVW